jgi:hypothetical protein
MDSPVRRLQLLEEEVDSGTIVTILIDGVDVLGGDEDRYGGLGWSSVDVLTTDSPFLPTSEPRRVALYRCGCGNWEDGNVTALIFERDGLVHWTDIRSMGGAFRGPATLDSWVDPTRLADETYVEAHSQPPLGVDDLTFDAVQYRTEIERAVRLRGATG